jgi:hypothetical protein
MDNNFPPDQHQPNQPHHPNTQPEINHNFPPPQEQPAGPVFAPAPAFSPPPAPMPVAEPIDQAELMPQPVIQVYSPRGVEYVFMTITLFGGAIGLISALLSVVNGQYSFSVLAFPTAIMLVSMPMYAWLFLRLKAAELANPKLRFDASKRRNTQLIQITGFLVCFFTLIGLLVFVFSKMSGDFDGSIVKVLLNALVILVVSGGILAYYWRDEHRYK